VFSLSRRGAAEDDDIPSLPILLVAEPPPLPVVPPETSRKDEVESLGM